MRVEGGRGDEAGGAAHAVGAGWLCVCRVEWLCDARRRGGDLRVQRW